MFGLGMKAKRGRKAKGAGVSGGGVVGDVGHTVVDVADSVASLFGLGLNPKKKHHAKGGYVSAGALSGSSNFRNPTIGNVQPLQPSLSNDFSRGGNIVDTAVHLLPLMALL